MEDNARVQLEKEFIEGIAKLQVTTSDEVIKREIIRQLIYKRANFISTGVKLVGIAHYDNLDIKYGFPAEAAVEYPVPEGAGASLSRINWVTWDYSLKKAEGRFKITDEATIRGVGRKQWETGIRRLSEGFAIAKDQNILDTLVTGTGNAVAAAATWATATAAQVTTDFSAVVNNLLSARGVLDTDIGNIAIVVPIAAWSGLLRILEVEGIRVSMMNWLKGSYGVSIMPSKYLTTDGVAVLKGPDTAEHGILNQPRDIPFVETKREEGIGTEYIVRQFFATQIVPEEEGVTTTTDRICTITTVA